MMTKDEALKLALESLEYHTAQTRPIHQTNETINAIKEALAQPEREPIGCAECGTNGGHALYCVACAEKYLKDKNTRGQKC